jgi:hypothetical protein
VAPLVQRLKDSRDRLSKARDSTLLDFDERDLLDFAERAGFRDVKLTYEVSIEHGAGAHWGSGLS